LKTPFLLVSFLPKRGPASQAVCPPWGLFVPLEGRLGMLSRPVPVHFQII